MDKGGAGTPHLLEGLKAEGKTVPKKEPKEIDSKVFLGSENTVLEGELKTKEGKFSQSSELKSKLASSNISTLLKKLKAVNKTSGSENVVSKGVKSEKKTAKSDEAVDQGFGPIIISEESQYSSKISSLVTKLTDVVEDVADEGLDLKANKTDRVNLLALVRDWNHVKREGQVEVEQEGARTPWRLDIYTRHKLSRNPSAPASFKDAGALARQLAQERIGHLFKCFASACDFSSDDGAEFVSHLQRDHQQSGGDRGWQCCVYCNLAYRTPEALASHVIAIHGSCGYQCPHCYHRAGSQVR